MLLNFILFIVICYLLFYPSGNYLIELTKLELNTSERNLAALPVGITFFIILNYIFAYLQLPYFSLLIIAFLLIYLGFYKRYIFKINFKNINKISTALILLGSILTILLTFFSGLTDKNGIDFINVNQVDGFSHLALIQSQALHFPPVVPSLVGFPLRGYHYFYDFLASRFILFFNFSAFDLQFRFLPVMLSLLFGISIYLFLNKTKNTVRNFALFLSYFGQGFTFFWLIFSKNGTFYVTDIPQSLQLILDPSIILSLIILFTAIFLFLNGKNYKTAILVGIMIGIISEIKVYVGIMGISSLILFCLIKFLNSKNKRIYYLLTIISTGIISIITFLPNNLGVAHLVWFPFLVYNHFITQVPFSFLKWALLLQYYQSLSPTIKIIARIIQLYIEAILLFWVQTLGIRIIALITVFKFIKAREKDDIKLILILSLILPILIPTFFVQSVSLFDILQFVWVLMLPFGILSAYFLADIYNRVNYYFKAFVIIILILLTFPGVFFIEKNYILKTSDLHFTHLDVKTINSIKENTSKDNFLINVFYSDDKTKSSRSSNLAFNGGPIVSALTGRSTYYERVNLKYDFLNDVYEKRNKDETDLVNAINNCDNSKIMEYLKTIGSFNIVSFNDFKCFYNNKNIVFSSKGDNVFYFKFRAIE